MALLSGIAVPAVQAQPTSPDRPPSAKPTLVQAKGGSNYVVFGLDGCDRANFLVVPSYRLRQPTIDAQLLAMFKGGQRRLRISVPMPDPASSELGQQTIAKFLEAIRHTGFEEILVVIGGGNPSPERWRTWDEAAYQRRWGRIVEVRRLLAASRLRYRIDLLNEGIPARNQPILLTYAQRLWTDYATIFGVADTLGFSIIPDPAQDRFAQLRAVYGARPPDVFDLHFYAGAGAAFLNAHRRLAELGYGRVPWIVGEGFYNDDREARELADAIKDSGQRVLFLLQWPLTSAKRCPGVDVDVPISFEAYAKAGF